MTDIRTGGFPLNQVPDALGRQLHWAPTCYDIRHIAFIAMNDLQGRIYKSGDVVRKDLREDLVGRTLLGRNVVGKDLVGKDVVRKDFVGKDSIWKDFVRKDFARPGQIRTLQCRTN